MDDKQLIDKLEELILMTISNGNYSLDFICSSLFLSRSQLHRRIIKIKGISTTKYIRKIRLEQAKLLLIHNRESKIKTIAAKVGINSSQNFSKYFKKEYGMTPSAFKLNRKPALKEV